MTMTKTVTPAPEMNKPLGYITPEAADQLLLGIDCQPIHKDQRWGFTVPIYAGPPPQLAVMAPDDHEEKLSDFLDALDEWGCDDNDQRAKHILEFQRHGYDLSAYEESPGREKSELN